MAMIAQRLDLPIRLTATAGVLLCALSAASTAHAQTVQQASCEQLQASENDRSKVVTLLRQELDEIKGKYAKCVADAAQRPANDAADKRIDALLAEIAALKTERDQARIRADDDLRRTRQEYEQRIKELEKQVQNQGREGLEFAIAEASRRCSVLSPPRYEGNTAMLSGVVSEQSVLDDLQNEAKRARVQLDYKEVRVVGQPICLARADDSWARARRLVNGAPDREWLTDDMTLVRALAADSLLPRAEDCTSVVRALLEQERTIGPGSSVTIFAGAGPTVGVCRAIAPPAGGQVTATFERTVPRGQAGRLMIRLR